MIKRIQRFAARTLLLKEAALQRGTKCCCTHGYHERRGSCVAFQAIQACWKKIRCPPDTWPVTPAEAGLISWAQQGRQLGFVPQKPVSLTGFTACCYMPVSICATVCESFLSHTLYPCLSVPMQFFSYVHAIFLSWTAVREANGHKAERSINAFLSLHQNLCLKTCQCHIYYLFIILRAQRTRTEVQI